MAPLTHRRRPSLGIEGIHAVETRIKAEELRNSNSFSRRRPAAVHVQHNAAVDRDRAARDIDKLEIFFRAEASVQAFQ